jgi:predicted transposase YbfD/YdcC
MEHFSNVKDFRQEWKVRHKLIDIIFIAVAGTLANCDSYEDIAFFAEIKEKWFRKYLELPNGIPSHDTIQRVFENLDVSSFSHCFINWTNEIADRSDRPIIAIDGKTVRRSYDKEKDKKAIHIVNAWIDTNKLVLGQLQTEEKSNEITAIPELLDMLMIKGCIITIDAMGTQKEIAKKIIDKKGDYILAVKDNQKALSFEIKEYLNEQLSVGFRDINPNKIAKKQTIEKGHGRIEKRTYYITNDIRWMEEKSKWKKLKSIGMVINEVTRGEEKTKEIRYYITSLDCKIEEFARGVRNHWGIESTHWILDVVFKEDDSRVRTNNGATNLSQLRKIALNILREEKVSKKKKKIALKRKRLWAGADEDFLEKVIFNQEN